MAKDSNKSKNPKEKVVKSKNTKKKLKDFSNTFSLQY